MSTAIQLEGEGGVEALLALHEAFIQAHVRCSRIRVAHPGTPEPPSEAVSLVVAPDLAADLAELLAAWLRLRPGDLTLDISRPDGTRFRTTLTAVRGLGPADQRALVQRLSRALAVPHPHLERPAS